MDQDDFMCCETTTRVCTEWKLQEKLVEQLELIDVVDLKGLCPETILGHKVLLRLRSRRLRKIRTANTSDRGSSGINTWTQLKKK